MSEIPPGTDGGTDGRRPVRTLRDHDGVVHEVRDLDPARARVRRARRVAPTRYVADRLIVRSAPGGAADDVLVSAVRAAAVRRGLDVRVSEAPVAGAREGASRQGVAVHVAGDDVDVWELLDEVGEGADQGDSVRLGLDHVLVGHKRTTGYGLAGTREPATFVASPPRRSHAAGDLWTTADGLVRPVVAIVDSGVGQHPWFDPSSPVVARGVLLDGAPIGTYDDREPDGDAAPDSTDEGTIGEYSGHGTFIAGVVHQVCPDAVILPVRISGASGESTEWDVARSLERLLDFHLRGVAGDSSCAAVDVVVLPLGYYPEETESDDYDGVLRGALRDLRAAGVLVVVSAGNDGSCRPVFPAAWAPSVRRVPGGPVVPERPADLVAGYTPLLTVTASNPNGTLADFANDGPWVTAVRAGAKSLSTMPTTFDGPATPRSRTPDGLRESVDPDDFRGGFALWSGTSFAAPVLAGELAVALLEARASGHETSSRVTAAWDAVVAVGDLYGTVPGS
ncbi:S8 family peptidase [Luteimicrobium subarcticum]|uniref:Subtilase family protein n=1 Tax=Luteimicrobium subarcticum TaxID=620910 RepID=A0A2M8WVI0_9MICO|nr:S8 family serine peptidase [Luteimicrobium subarcticum]PJI94935.1 subtilase family protein [Luteimicrobium subarcticum]